MSVTAVIFDLDGTLIDSYQAHFKAWTSVAAEIGLALTEPQFQDQFGRRNEPILMELHELAGKPPPTPARIDTLAEIKETRYRAMIAAAFPEMPGATELIGQLKQAGWKVAIGSSAPRPNIDFCIERFNRLGAEFDAVACGDDVAHGKPAPDVFLLAASRLGVSPEACVVLEDAPVGIEAAHRAGMGSVGVCSRGRTRAELAEAGVVVERLSELTPERLASLCGAAA